MIDIKVVAAVEAEDFEKQASELIAKGYETNRDFRILVLDCSDGNQRLRYTGSFTKYANNANQSEEITVDPDEGRSIPTPFDEAIEEAVIQIKGHHKGQKAIWAEKLTKLLNDRREWRYAMDAEPEIARHFGSDNS